MYFYLIVTSGYALHLKRKKETAKNKNENKRRTQAEPYMLLANCKESKCFAMRNG